MVEYLSNNKYAKSLGVSQPAITLAIKENRVIRTTRGVDPTHPSNVHYENGLRAKRGPLPKDLGDQPAPPVHEDPAPSKIEAKKEAPAPRTRRRPSAAAPAPKPKQTAPAPNVNHFKTKVDYDIEKLEVQTAKLRAELANNLGVTVLRAMVDRAFAQIHSAAVNFLLPLGARLAPVLAGICGVTKAETILEIQTKIDEEILRALGLIKDVENFNFVEDAPEVEVDADAS